MRPDGFQSFVRSVHRRLVLVRAVELAGIGAAVGCGFGFVLIALLWTVGREGLALGSGLAGMGAAIGLLWGLIRRTSVMQAAVEADRQLGLADLLSSAWVSRRSKETRSDDQWSQAVVALAEARCRALSPNAIVVHRLGGRAWGGIGLSLLLVVTIGMLTTLPETRRVKADVSSEASHAQSKVGEAFRLARQPLRDAVPREGQGASERPLASDGDSTATGLQSDRRLDGMPSSGSGAGGVGSTRDRSDGGLPLATTSGRNDPSGTTAAGGSVAPATSDNSAVTGTALGLRGADQAKTPVPAWRRPDWSGDRAKAIQAVENGSIPDEYRDVVRAYFDAPQAE